jgi:hypothetical protein
VRTLYSPPGTVSASVTTLCGGRLPRAKRSVVQVVRILIRRRRLVLTGLALGALVGVLEYQVDQTAQLTVLLGAPLSGLAIGLLLVALLRRRGITFKSEHDVRELLSIPVLALIPSMEEQDEQPARGPDTGFRFEENEPS